MDKIPFIVCTAFTGVRDPNPQDFPTISFGKHESIEMPFRESSI